MSGSMCRCWRAARWVHTLGEARWCNPRRPHADLGCTLLPVVHPDGGGPPPAGALLLVVRPGGGRMRTRMPKDGDYMRWRPMLANPQERAAEPDTAEATAIVGGHALEYAAHPPGRRR